MAASVLLSLFACTQNGVSVYNTPPTATITSPEDGAILAPGETLELEGIARDAQQEPPTLILEWSSSIDGDLGTATADSDGIVVLPVTEMSTGTHAITLTAIDDEGEAGTSTVTVDIGYGGGVEGAPTVTLLGPLPNEEIPASVGLTVVGSVTDDEQTWDTLSATILSSRDGVLWTGAPESNGGVSVPLSGLSVGPHSLILKAEDDDGHVGEASVDITILEDANPLVTILDPGNGSSWWTDETLVLDAEVDDDMTDPASLSLTLTSDYDGVIWSGFANSAGVITRSFSLSEAVHTLTLSAIDEDGNEGSDSVSVEVIDPLNYDNDGDGYTEYEGDCDDGEPKVNPGMAEVCDGVDQNCDGNVNETWWDSYEENDTSSTYYDLGEVDASWLWDGDALVVSGLTQSAPLDEDWFYFDVDDEIYDNASFNVQVAGLPTAGRWVIELYDMNGGSPSLEDSASGNGGKMTVYFSGDWTDTGEDNWAVRIYSTSWTAGGCTTAYTLTITT